MAVGRCAAQHSAAFFECGERCCFCCLFRRSVLFKFLAIIFWHPGSSKWHSAGQGDEIVHRLAHRKTSFGCLSRELALGSDLAVFFHRDVIWVRRQNMQRWCAPWQCLSDRCVVLHAVTPSPADCKPFIRGRAGLVLVHSLFGVGLMALG